MVAVIFEKLVLIVLWVNICSSTLITINANEKTIFKKDANNEHQEIYTFYEGQSVNFTCSSADPLSSVNILSNATLNTDDKFIEMNLANNLESFLFLKLSEADDKTVINCQINNIYSKQYISVYIILSIQYSAGSDFKDIEPIKSNCKNNPGGICYKYPYYSGESVSLESNKEWHCHDKGDLQSTSHKVTSRKINFTKEKTLEYGLENEICTRTKPDMEMVFVPYPMENQFCTIDGLSFKNTLGIFRSTVSRLKILYQYTEKLNLTCVAKGEPRAFWITNETAVEGPTAVTNGLYVLKENFTHGNIFCTNNQSYVEIVLIRVKYVVKLTPKPNPPIKFKSEEIRNNKDEREGTEEPNENGGHLSQEIIAVIAVVCLVSIIGAISFAVCQCMKKKPVSQNPDTNITYENLPEHNKGTMPVPAQWQEAQYAAPADRIANNDYAVPYKPTVEEMYSTAVPKSKRVEVDNSGYVTVDSKPKKDIKGVAVLPNDDKMYAALCLPHVAKKSNYKASTSSENPYQDINECAYSEVSFGENPYAEPNNFQAKGYVNVFNDSRYVNAEGKTDYAEPAYCELSKEKK